MNTWEAMAYDEQRALLGLPDVRWYVATQSMKRTISGLKEAFDRFAEAIAPAAQAFIKLAQSLEPDTGTAGEGAQQDSNLRLTPPPSVFAITCDIPSCPICNDGEPW